MPDPQKSIYATGRRKHAVARVWLQPGTGKVDINRRTLEDYFGRETSRMVFRQALELTEMTGRFDVFVNGVEQARGIDYEVVGRSVVFPRPIAQEGRLGFWRWAFMWLGVVGSYRKHENVDVVYEVNGRRQVATGLRPKAYSSS